MLLEFRDLSRHFRHNISKKLKKGKEKRKLVVTFFKIALNIKCLDFLLTNHIIRVNKNFMEGVPGT